MGTRLMELYREKVKKSWKIAFFAAFLGFFLIHLYKVTNYLPNHDSVFNAYSDQNMTGSGRWFLEYACAIGSYFDLQWLNGLLCAIYLGVASVCITELFDLENPVAISLISLLLVACPSTTETLLFGFTADGYCLGLMMCALAALLSAKGSGWRKSVISGVLLCLALGIYQSYISFAAVLCACYMVNLLLNDRCTVKNAWKWVARHVVIYASAALTYFVIWKLTLALTGQTANDYQGINEVGSLKIATLVSGAMKSVGNLVLLFLEWDIREHPVSLYGVLNIVFVALLVGLLAAAVVRGKIYRNMGRLLTILAFLGACIPVISIWNFASDGVVYRPMMLHGACVFYFFAVVLAQQQLKPSGSTLVALFMAVMIFNFGVMANISYTILHKEYEYSYYRGSRMMEDIQQAEDDSVTEIAFLGKTSIELPDDYGNKVHILSQNLEQHLLYDDIHTWYYLREVFNLDIPMASPETREALGSDPTVQQMPVWPAEGSCLVLDGMLVVKIGE